MEEYVMAALTNKEESIEMRKVYCETMIQLAQKNPAIVALDCDLMGPIGMGPFQKAFPERMIDCGIMEGNMAGVAAGMSARGCIPFAHTFSCFQSRKCIDQLFLSAGFADLNVKAVGSDPGILALYNGASHMGLEDMGILKNIPGMTLVEPCDAVQLKWTVENAAETYGNFYIRMNRKNAETVYEEGSVFEFGKGNVLRDGKDVTLIAAGMMVKETLKAAAILEAEGIDAAVIDLFTWKPVDEDLIISYAEKTGALVTAENHRIDSGLGSAVAGVLADKCPTPLGRIGVADVYGEVGVLPYLLTRFKMTPEDIAQKAKETIRRK